MRYIKADKSLTIRVPLLSIESADYIFYTGKDLNWAFERAKAFIGADLEALGDWQVKAFNGKTINYRHFKIVNFWGLGPCSVCKTIGCMDLKHSNTSMTGLESCGT